MARIAASKPFYSKCGITIHRRCEWGFRVLGTMKPSFRVPGVRKPEHRARRAEFIVGVRGQTVRILFRSRNFVF